MVPRPAKHLLENGAPHQTLIFKALGRLHIFNIGAARGRLTGSELPTHQLLTNTDTYRELWRIEESFKVTKSELRTRPVYVRTPDHVEAHLLVCYVALTILRLLQLATGLPCPRIREEMAAMSGTNVDANWWVFDHRTDESDLLAEAVGLEELKLKCLTTGRAMEVLAKAAKGAIPHAK